MSPLRKIFGGKQRGLTKVEADLVILEQLRKLGADLSQPREVLHFLYLPTLDASHRATDVLRTKGYETQERAAANASDNPPNPFLVKATRNIVLDARSVTKFRALFEELASIHGGEYDGWEAAVKP